MCLTNEHVGPKILAKIKICVLTRAELLITLCYEIPCNLGSKDRALTPGVHLSLFSGPQDQCDNNNYAD